MKHSEAILKECPFQSHRAPILTVTSSGEYTTATSYTIPIMCSGFRCMSWISTNVFNDKDPEGYCQLIKPQKITIQ